MNDVVTIIVAISGVGFGFGVCGVGILRILNWLEGREDAPASARTSGPPTQA